MHCPPEKNLNYFTQINIYATTFALMQKIIAFILLLCVSYQCTVKLGIVAWYEWNKKYVATELCENKDKPQMHCCGKCYLRKQLNKVDDGNEKNTSKNLPAKWEKIEVSPCVIPEKIAFSVFNPSEEKIFHSYFRCPAGYDPLSSVFHPPLSC